MSVEIVGADEVLIAEETTTSFDGEVEVALILSVVLLVDTCALEIVVQEVTEVVKVVPTLCGVTVVGVTEDTVGNVGK